MLFTSSPDYGLVIQSTHWSTIWVDHTFPSDLTYYMSSSNSIWITTFLTFILILSKSSCTGTLTVEITDTNIYGSQAPCMLPVLACLVGAPIKFTVGRFSTRKGLSASILYFWIEPLTRVPLGPLIILPFLGVMLLILILIHYPHHCTSIIMCMCCIATAYHTITSSLLAISILWIGTTNFWLSTRLPRDVH